jgi:N-acetylmuramoyl-L-alanine amidase
VPVRAFGAAPLLLLLTAAPAVGAGKDLTLGFDGLADLASNVGSFGVTITGATVLACGASLNCAQFPPFSGRNVIYDSGGGTISAAFDVVTTGPVEKVSARITGNTNITMTAYDKDGVVITTAQTGGPNYAGVGTPNKLLTVLAPDAVRTIYRVTFHDSGNTYTIDDLTFTSNNRVVVIDPGHGLLLDEDGVTLHYQRLPSPTFGLIEDILTLNIAEFAAADLAGGAGGQKYITYMTRTSSKAPLQQAGCGKVGEDRPYDYCNDDLKERRKRADNWEADVFVSVHTNGSFFPTNNGTFALTCGASDTSVPIAAASVDLAQRLVGEVATRGVANRGVRVDCKGVLRSNVYPSALIEVAHHTHWLALPGAVTDEQRLNSPIFRANAGISIATGVRSFIQEYLDKVP